jgi:hypothetical protein
MCLLERPRQDFEAVEPHGAPLLKVQLTTGPDARVWAFVAITPVIRRPPCRCGTLRASFIDITRAGSHTRSSRFFGKTQPGAKREAGAAQAKAGAAPATVCGEPTSPCVTGIARSWEGRTEATTHEPGDLPRHVERPRAGCPGGALAFPAASAARIPMPRRYGLCPNTWG